MAAFGTKVRSGAEVVAAGGAEVGAAAAENASEGNAAKERGKEKE